MHSNKKIRVYAEPCASTSHVESWIGLHTLLAISAQILLSCGLLGKFAVMSSYQLSAFGLGQIKVHLYHGLAPYAISGHNVCLLRAEALVNA